ncbi:MAG: hypothetical protein ACT4PP_11995 [Sporichthyaceae bacterium]
MRTRYPRRRLAAAAVSVALGTAALSLAGASGAAAAPEDRSGLLGSALATLDDTLGDTVNVLPPVLGDLFGDLSGGAAPRSGDEGGSKPRAKGLLGDTTAALKDTTAELPLLGPALSGTVDELGESVPVLDPAPVTTEAKPPATKGAVRPERPVQGAETVRGPGVTWTMPMMTDPAAVAPVAGENDAPGGDNSGSFVPILDKVLSVLPSTAVGAAQLGVGAATVALIVLGGIAITGAAGAASVVGRRDLAGTTAGAGTLGGMLR